MKKQATFTVWADMELPGIGRTQCRVKRPTDPSYVFGTQEEAAQVMTDCLTRAKDLKIWDCKIVTKR